MNPGGSCYFAIVVGEIWPDSFFRPSEARVRSAFTLFPSSLHFWMRVLAAAIPEGERLLPR